MGVQCSKGPFALDDNDVFFLSSCANSYIMQPISDDMVKTSKICVAVVKCERALSYVMTAVTQAGLTVQYDDAGIPSAFKS